MPFKSQAQRRKFYAMESRGEIPKGTTQKWEAHTPKGKKLPQKVKKPKKTKKPHIKKVASDNDRFRSSFMGAAGGAIPGALVGAFAGKGSLKHIAAGATVGGIVGGTSGYLLKKDPTSAVSKAEPIVKDSKKETLESHAQFNEGKDVGRKSVIISYKKMNGRTVKRKIDPLKVKDDNLVIAYDNKRQAIRSFKIDQIKDMKKVANMKELTKLAFFAIDPMTAGSIGSIVSGYQSGRSSAKSVSNMVSNRGYKTKNEELAGTLAKGTATAGAVAGLAYGLKNKHKAINFLRKNLSNHHDMSAIYDLGVPFLSGTTGGIAAGGATGALVGLRGKFNKKPIDRDKDGKANERKKTAMDNKILLKRIAGKIKDAVADKADDLIKRKTGIDAGLAEKLPGNVIKLDAKKPVSHMLADKGLSNVLEKFRIGDKAADVIDIKTRQKIASRNLALAGLGLAGMGASALVGHKVGKKKGTHEGIRQGVNGTIALQNFKKDFPNHKVVGLATDNKGGVIIRTDKGNFKGTRKPTEKKASLAENLYHGLELGGLGILAAPSVYHMSSGKEWSDDSKHKAELVGLGALALPSMGHIAMKVKPLKSMVAKVPALSKAFL